MTRLTDAELAEVELGMALADSVTRNAAPRLLSELRTLRELAEAAPNERDCFACGLIGGPCRFHKRLATYFAPPPSKEPA